MLTNPSTTDLKIVFMDFLCFGLVTLENSEIIKSTSLFSSNLNNS